MARAEYIRKKQYNRRRRKIVAYTTRVAVGLGVVVLAVLAFFGCIYVRDTFWGEESVLSNSMSSANGSAGEVQQIPTVLDDEQGFEGGQETLQAVQTEDAENKETELPTVVVDAGHGGNDGGTYSGKIIEKDITLAVAKKMQKLLEEQDINVIMTRETDEYMELKERTQISNENDTDLFISVHCNYYEGGSEVKGIECYYAEDDEISKKVAETIMKNIDKISGLRNRGAKEEDYFVTEFNDAPAVLVEMGFLSNPTECKNLADSDYQQSLAEELVEGVLKSLKMLEEEADKASDSDITEEH